jgi:hypothetical protein
MAQLAAPKRKRTGGLPPEAPQGEGVAEPEGFELSIIAIDFASQITD